MFVLLEFLLVFHVQYGSLHGLHLFIKLEHKLSQFCITTTTTHLNNSSVASNDAALKIVAL